MNRVDCQNYINLDEQTPQNILDISNSLDKVNDPLFIQAREELEAERKGVQGDN